MITDDVIKEIYKKYGKKPKNPDYDLDHFIELLSQHHNIRKKADEIFIDDLEEFNPFRRFLIRNINAILEFDQMVAFVFPSHILFFGKNDNALRVHIKLEKPRSFLGRLFHRD